VKGGGVGAVRALAERRAVAKTSCRKRIFGNRVVSVQNWWQEPLWGGRGDVASLGLAPDPLRHGARRVDE